MLLTEEVEVAIGGKNISYYENLGYKIPRIKNINGIMQVPRGVKIKVKTKDLSIGAKVNINCRCDNCNKLLENIKWANYKKCVHEDGKYYCHDCALKLYGGENKRISQLKKGESLAYWLIKNLSLKQAISVIVRWDEEKNGKDIREVGYSSTGFNKKGYWFKCPRGIHESELHNINSFTSKVNKLGKSNVLDCDRCNSIAQWGIDNLGEDFLEKYWDYEKNVDKDGNPINPWKINYGSNKTIWIKCQKESYHDSYDTKCHSFTTMSSRCPYCAGQRVHVFDSLGWLYPQVFNIWSEKNEKSPYDYMPFSTKKVWWKCYDGKHKDYYREIDNSILKSDFRCPECVRERKESFLQEKVRLYLESLDYKSLHEYDCSIIPINPKTRYPLPFDNEIALINNKKLIIEVMGSQHYEVTGFHIKHAKNNDTTPEYELHYQKLKDRYKRFITYKRGYEYLEIPYWTDDKNETWKELINNKINIILDKKYFKEVI